MGKMPKDPNAPSRPLSAYLLWSNQMRQKVVKENPEASMIEVSRLMGKLWSNTKEDEREPFKKKAQVAKVKYEKELASYKRSDMYEKFQVTKADFKKKALRKPFRKDVNAPKKPLSAYMIFVADFRENVVSMNPGKSQTEILVTLGKMWRDTSSNDQAKYKVKAQEAKEKYMKVFAKYQKTPMYKEYMAEKSEYDAMMKVKREKANPKPKKAKKLSKPSVGSTSRSRSVSRRRKVSTRRRSVKRKARRRVAKARLTKRSKKRQASVPKAPKKGKKASVSRSPSSVSRMSSSSRSRSRSTSRSRASSRRRRVSRTKQRRRRKASTPKAPMDSESESVVSSSRSRSSRRRKARRAKSPKRKSVSRSRSKGRRRAVKRRAAKRTTKRRA